PYEAQFQMENKPSNNRDADGASVAMSDESHFSWTLWVPHLNFVTGDYDPTTANWNNWPFMYEGIDKTTKAIVNLSRCNELSEIEKKTMIAEARFLRAYCYFQILRRFGPAIVLKDNKLYTEIDKTTIDRNTIDETVGFIISEIDQAKEDLPLQMSSIPEYSHIGAFGQITRGAALAAKSRILLYAASPLFNGCDLYKGNLVNKSGHFLFPQTYDPEKWTKAADAAKAVIDLNCYNLYEDSSETDPLLKAIKSYQGVQFEPWNDEIIWGYWPRLCPYSQSGGVGYIAYLQRARYCPTEIIAQGCSGYCPSLKLVDAYPMSKSGRYPVIGYSENGQPIIDKLSGYNNEGFSSNWSHPIEGAKLGLVKAHNSCVGRDARFYASVLANGFYWLNDNTRSGSKTIVTFHYNGTSPYKNLGSDCSKVGFLWRRFMPSELNYEYNEWGTFFWFYYRLAEIYLNYAEACNEKPTRDVTEALKYINLIRNRAGLNNLEVAYPEIDFYTNKVALREMIRKERMIELAFEGHRYYDCRRWMIAEKEFNYLPLTLNLYSNNYEDSWKRVDNIWNRKMSFAPKHYFIPINQQQLDELTSITQNYGW
ncbi:MAG: RagB/SusD family nutrient uptake outer membrane protein, partial [Muribaculaceae bacterium]|nr:RagB/SusD family nutrient uptake outer membrane protein [Muribaculaceae bacterium]